jgi:hypothetical protein
MVQLVQVVALDRVLVLGGALPAADPARPARPGDQGGPGHHRELGPQPVDDLVAVAFRSRRGFSEMKTRPVFVVVPPPPPVKAITVSTAGS